MTALALTVALALLAALTALQILVASKFPLGRLVWGGHHEVLPPRLRIGSVISVALYLVMATLLLSRAAVIPGSESALVRVATWVLFAYFTLGILTNAISRSRSERLTMTPVSFLLAATTLVIALER